MISSEYRSRELAWAAMCIAMIVIFTHIIAIQTPYTRIDFSALAIAIAAMFFKPVVSGLIAVLADIIGCLILGSGLYFPGFSISAFITGYLFSCFFYNKNIKLTNSILACLFELVVVNICLNTIWLYFISGDAIYSLLMVRTIKCLIMFPINVLIIYVVCNRIFKFNLQKT